MPLPERRRAACDRRPPTSRPPPGGIQVRQRTALPAASSASRRACSRSTLRAPREFDRAQRHARRRASARHGARAGARGAAAQRAARRSRRPRSARRRAQRAHRRPARRRPRSGARWARRTVQYFHAEEIGAKPRLARFAARRRPTLSIAVSRYTAGLLVAAGAAARAHASSIPNGVDLPERAGRRCRRERPTILTIARIEERYKGHDVLVRALRAGAREGARRAVGRDRRRARCAPGIEALAPLVRRRRRVPLPRRASPTRSATPGCAARTCSRCRAGCRPAASPGRASGSSTWRRRVRQAGRRGQRRRRARRGARRRDRPAGRPAGPASRSRRRSPACCSTASSRERLGAAGRRARRAATPGRGRRAGAGALLGLLDGREARAREGPLRQPHGDGQRRRALAARPARRAAGDGRSRVLASPRGRAGRERARARASPVDARSAARPGSLRLHPLHTPRALAEMALAAAAGARGCARAAARSSCTPTRSARGSSAGSRGWRGAVARARARLPAAGPREHRDAAADRARRRRVVLANSRYTARSVLRGGAGRARARSSTTRRPRALRPAARSTARGARAPRLRRRAAAAARRRRPAHARGRARTRRSKPSAALRAQGVDAHLLLVGSAKFVGARDAL